MEKYSLTYINELGKKCQADFKVNEYHSLMELLFDKYFEEWVDCKGRAWCGTCHIEILEGNITEGMDENEGHMLSKIDGSTSSSRFVCQIPVSKQLSGVVFKIAADI
ncbi:2Fe-2S iron-sulfur cluster-binding protein [Muriicola sp. E247]|uniref:2Fe-2S iron-sulfur cluster-binding protein n=1 Tax=Muriicola sp. E247 TaxID=3242730 RepID=UPI003525FCA4